MSVPCMSIALPDGTVTRVSPQDYDDVIRINWCNKGNGYVHGRWRKELGGDGKQIMLHRYIMRPDPGYVVDHIDGDPMNNTRDNLQITTYARNSMRAKSLGSISQLGNGRYRVRMRVDGRMISYGCFATREEAEMMRQAAVNIVWHDPEFNSMMTQL